MITLARYITSDGKYPAFINSWSKCPDVEKLNSEAKKLIAKVSTLLNMAKLDNVQITSGWRTVAHNFAIGGAANSRHISAQAVDIWDPDKILGQWCETNQEFLKYLNVYMESLTRTHAAENRMKRWTHLQTVAPKSGHIIFDP